MAYTKECQNCGKTFETLNYRQKHCSHTCANQHRENAGFDTTLNWKRSATNKWVWQCPYNKECECYGRRCNKCGWNPEVAKARTEAIMGKMCGEHGK